jgi:putative ABC transport system permease protein
MLAILLYQSFLLALGQIWANKLRSILTCIGIVIGVASVTVVIAALTGLQDAVLSDVEEFGTNKVFIFPKWPETGPLKNASWRLIRFHPDMFDGLLEHCPAINTFYLSTDDRYTITAGAKSEDNVDVTAVQPEWHRVERRTAIAGRELMLVDEEEARPVCMINESLRDRLQLPTDCIGHSIQIGDRRFIIIGLLQKRADSMFFGEGGSSSEVIVPFSSMYTNWSWISVVAAAKSPDQAAEAVAEATFYLRQVRHIHPGDEDTFGVEYIERLVQQFNQIASVITEVATGVVGISLIVGGVGIMNIMLVSVSERTREIGLRKAVGAPPAAILMQFLVEAITLCFFGGAIGVGMGMGLTYFISILPIHLEKSTVPAWAIALSFGFAASVGLIFGMFPAIKASRLDPIEAIRHE